MQSAQAAICSAAGITTTHPTTHTYTPTAPSTIAATPSPNAAVVGRAGANMNSSAAASNVGAASGTAAGVVNNGSADLDASQQHQSCIIRLANMVQREELLEQVRVSLCTFFCMCVVCVNTCLYMCFACVNTVVSQRDTCLACERVQHVRCKCESLIMFSIKCAGTNTHAQTRKHRRSTTTW